MAMFRKLRRRFLPFVPTGDEIRAMRAKFLRSFGLARTREPRLLIDRPELRYGSVLKLTVAEHIIRFGKLNFLQVGAFDGSQNDEILGIIKQHPVAGILVEPQPKVFAKLNELHGSNSNLQLVNAAIGSEIGVQPFFMSKKVDLECASFDRQHLLNHGIEPLDICSQDVECLTVDEVLRRGNLDSIDLLQIDAEGYDYEIIKTIDFAQISPRILRFEFRHLSNQDLDDCLQMLAEHGYKFIVEDLDLIAINTNDSHELAHNPNTTGKITAAA